MKKLLLILSILISSIGFAQDPILQKDNPNLQKEAFAITRAYNKELALDGKQIILFEKKVEEFLIRREEIKQRYSGKRQLDALVNLQAQESLEMRNILTQPQMDIYKKIKRSIQPLAEVEE